MKIDIIKVKIARDAIFMELDEEMESENGDDAGEMPGELAAP